MKPVQVHDDLAVKDGEAHNDARTDDRDSVENDETSEEAAAILNKLVSLEEVGKVATVFDVIKEPSIGLEKRPKAPEEG